MRERLIKTAAIFLAVLGFATVQLRAEIPIVQADTVFQGFGGGSVSGIVFGPTGETVILMHDAQPVEINIKTKQIVREFEKVPNAQGDGSHTFIVNGFPYLVSSFNSSEILGIKNFAGDVVWDLNTGKILKVLPNIMLLTDGNMNKYFTYWNHNFCSYDFEKFKLKDSFNLDNIETYHIEWRGYGIIPNSNKVLIGANRYTEFTPGQKEYKQAELYLMDFDTKEFTKIPIPYESWQTNAQISGISVSETGKYKIVSLNIFNVDYYYFLDKNMNFLYKMTLSDFELLTNTDNIFNTALSLTLTDDYLIFYISSNDLKVRKMFSFDIQKKNILKYLSFIGTGLYNRTSQKIALYGILGITGIYSLEALPVQDNSQLNQMENVQYKDSNLIINANLPERVDITITDYNGNLLHTQNDVFLQKGSNSIKINLPLANGIYFCVIKSIGGSNSFKFIVSN
jgi:hypothetical protein